MVLREARVTASIRAEFRNLKALDVGRRMLQGNARLGFEFILPRNVSEPVKAR